MRKMINQDDSAGFIWLNSIKNETAFFREGKIPSLAPFKQMLARLGHPDLEFKNRIIIGGTAGKGSVCRYIEQALLLKGLNTTLISSPHLQIPEERIRVNGKLCSTADLDEALLRIKSCATESEIQVTYYEAMVLAGLLIGQKNGGILIGEIGLGGTWDALNAIEGSRISGLTFIGPDHLDILGPKLEDIAKTKAGIFNQNCIQGFCTDKNFCSIIEKNSKCNIQFIKGINSKLNKKLARKIIEQILCTKDFKIPKLIAPGRWEKLSDILLIEGAHSRPRFEYIISKIKKITGPKTAVLAMSKNHNFQDFEVILSLFDEVIWTSIPEKDCWDPIIIQKHFKVGQVIQDPLKAHQIALNNPGKTIVTGSFYLCGIIRSLYYKPENMRTQQTEYPLLK